MKDLTKLTRPEIMKMSQTKLSLAVAQLMDWELKPVRKDDGTLGERPADYFNNFQDMLDIIKKLQKDGEVVMLHFPTKDTENFIIARYIINGIEVVIDEIDGPDLQELILKTALLANLPKDYQIRSIKRKKNK